ncbi:MAG: hypothetical protein HOE90_08870 [Bacteriovoracaceae bacterium]|jgi:L-threonylcarbamoyladenylate synthase|nr:hypothetical protein [Bacteriovoracaceae bacterium]
MKNQLIVYPTDTVWGIGCDAGNAELIKEVHLIKKSSASKPMSILFSDFELLEKNINLPSIFSKSWLSSFFRLETSLCLSRKFIDSSAISESVLCGSDYVSIRLLDYPWCKEICTQIGGPMVSTSLNFSGDPPITSTESAKEFFDHHVQNGIFIGPAGEKCLSGSVSTIVIYNENGDFEFLRQGAKVDEVKKSLEVFSA